MPQKDPIRMQHIVSIPEIRHGDHIYVRLGFEFMISREGIIVPTKDQDPNERWMVITNGAVQTDESCPQLRRVTLSEFRTTELKLRRVYYDQVDNVLHHFKLPGTSYADRRVPTDSIVENASILYRLSQSPNVYGGQLKILLGDQYERFAYICSTTYAKNWTFMLNSNGIGLQSFPDDVQNSCTTTETVQGTSRDEIIYLTL